MHIFDVLNGKFDKEAKDNHVKNVDLVKNVFNGDAILSLTKT